MMLARGSQTTAVDGGVLMWRGACRVFDRGCQLCPDLESVFVGAATKSTALTAHARAAEDTQLRRRRAMAGRDNRANATPIRKPAMWVHQAIAPNAGPT